MSCTAATVGATAGVRPQGAIALLPFALVVALRVLRTPSGVRRAAWAAAAGLAVGLVPYVPVVAGSGGLGSYLVAAKAVGIDSSAAHSSNARRQPVAGKPGATKTGAAIGFIWASLEGPVFSIH